MLRIFCDPVVESSDFNDLHLEFVPESVLFHFGSMVEIKSLLSAIVCFVELVIELGPRGIFFPFLFAPFVMRVDFHTNAG